MGKKNDKKVEDIEFEILAAEARLEVLKKKKERLENKVVNYTQFNDLPESIENISAHIAIRLSRQVIILFEYDDKCFCIYNCGNFSILDYDFLFDGEGKHRSRHILPFYQFDLNTGESITYKFFGCVITPDGDTYTIEPLKLNKNGVVVFEED